MALTVMTDNVEIIQELGTYPNQDDGLDAEGLKAKFDEAAKLLKNFINEWIVPQHNSLEQMVYDDYDTCCKQYEELLSKINALQNAVESNRITADSTIKQLKELLQATDTQLLEDLNALSAVVEENKNAAALGDEQLRDDLAGTQLELVTEKQDRQAADSALSARLDQEIAERKNADEENLYLAIEHTDSTKNDILNEMYDIETGIRNQLAQDKASLEEADNGAAARLDALEKDYRHIATVTQDTDEEIKQIDITANSEGNAFSCSEFLIFLTLPTSDEIYNDYKTQLYIGYKMYNWEVLFRQAFSRTVQRKWRIHLRHLYNGWWAADGAHSEDANDYAVNMLQNVGNVKSSTQAGETVSELHFLTTANIPNGTIFEIYGK